MSKSKNSRGGVTLEDSERKIRLRLVDRHGSLIMDRASTTYGLEHRIYRTEEMSLLRLIFEGEARERGVRLINPDFKKYEESGVYEFKIEYLGRKK